MNKLKNKIKNFARNVTKELTCNLTLNEQEQGGTYSQLLVLANVFLPLIVNNHEIDPSHRKKKC